MAKTQKKKRLKNNFLKRTCVCSIFECTRFRIHLLKVYKEIKNNNGSEDDYRSGY